MQAFEGGMWQSWHPSGRHTRAPSDLCGSRSFSQRIPTDSQFSAWEEEALLFQCRRHSRWPPQLCARHWRPARREPRGLALSSRPRSSKPLVWCRGLTNMSSAVVLSVEAGGARSRRSPPSRPLNALKSRDTCTNGHLQDPKPENTDLFLL